MDRACFVRGCKNETRGGLWCDRCVCRVRVLDGGDTEAAEIERERGNEEEDCDALE